MRSTQAFLLAAAAAALAAAGAAAQFGRPPAPRPAPPRPTPAPIPVAPRHTAPPARPAAPRRSDHTAAARSAALAAGAVGLAAPDQCFGAVTGAALTASPPPTHTPPPPAGQGIARVGSGPPHETAGLGGWGVAAAVAVVAGAVSAVAAAVARRRRSAGAEPRGVIRIIAPPPGEAPEAVRRAWVGLDLPFTAGGPEPVRVVGAVSNAGAGTAVGYGVDGRVAVERLAAWAPDAAAWWRANAPHVLARGYQLVFPAEVCERVS